jgi:O-antigen/teichoic acid export membrane protein
VIPFVLGNKYNSSIDVFNIYMIGNIISLAVTPVSLVLYTLNKEPYFALLNFLQLISYVIGSYFLIPMYGAVGAAWMYVFTKVLGFVMIYYQLWKEKILSAH